MGSDEGRRTVPRVPYEVLVRFLDEQVRDGPLPPRIDRSYLREHGESVRERLLETLGLLGLLDPVTGRVLPSLGAVAGHPAARRRELRGWAASCYRPELELAEAGASAMELHVSFVRGGTTEPDLRAAVAFFLELCHDVGLPRSERFRLLPPGLVFEAAAPRERPDSARYREFGFGDAGGVSIWADLRWEALPPGTATRLRLLLAELEDLSGNAAGQELAPPPGS